MSTASATTSQANPPHQWCGNDRRQLAGQPSKRFIQQTFFGVSAVFVITRDNDLIMFWRGQSGGAGQSNPGAGGAETAETDAAAEAQHRSAVSNKGRIMMACPLSILTQHSLEQKNKQRLSLYNSL